MMYLIRFPMYLDLIPLYPYKNGLVWSKLSPVKYSEITSFLYVRMGQTLSLFYVWG